VGYCRHAVKIRFFKRPAGLDRKRWTRNRESPTAFGAYSLRFLFIGIILFSGHFNSAASTTWELQQQPNRLEGVVLDQSRSPVSNALVSFNVPHHQALRTVTDADGLFLFELMSDERGRLVIEATGFARVERVVLLRELPATRIEVVLTPAPIREEVTITASRTETRIDETAASVRVVSSRDLSATAAATIDDALRQVPGFQLFRRSGSRTANPTSQGVSLRGVGASGASRALVLADGIPLNDPFGGWIYWGRVPRQSLSRVEVVRGGASDLYGSGAMGGVIGLISKQLGSPLFEIEGSYGNQKTWDASVFTSGRRGKLGASLAGEILKTAGYIVVPENQRGAVDTAVNSGHSAINLKLEYHLAENVQLFLGASYFGEARANGTPLQTNRTHIRQLTAGVDWESQSVGVVSARLYTGAQLFDQNFSAIAADRQSETLTRLQRVPAQTTGFTFQWSRALGAKHTLISGVDAREVRGASDELAYVQGRPSSFLGAGGRERDFGLFMKDIVRVTPQLTLVGGARFDHWRNYGAHSDTRPVRGVGPTTVKLFPARAESAFSPQFSVLYKPHETVSVFASAYGAFRAPTLNELYRSFRVGNVLTLANESLRAERLVGGEGGVTVRPFHDKLSLRGSFFWTEITRSIANVTVSSTPDLITRERRNLGRTRSRGLELESEFDLGRYWSASIGYLFADSSVVEFPGTPALEGLRIPQVARHNFTFQVQYANPSLAKFGLQGRAASDQFDDDLNLFRLPGFFTVDAFASRRLGSKLEVFVAAENVFNQRYMTGRTPVVTLGPPRLLRLGFRVHVQKK
jgi:iron complex outermembrane receptor protein